MRFSCSSAHFKASLDGLREYGFGRDSVAATATVEACEVGQHVIGANSDAVNNATTSGTNIDRFFMKSFGVF